MRRLLSDLCRASRTGTTCACVRMRLSQGTEEGRCDFGVGHRCQSVLAFECFRRADINEHLLEILQAGVGWTTRIVSFLWRTVRCAWRRVMMADTAMLDAGLELDFSSLVLYGSGYAVGRDSSPSRGGGRPRYQTRACHGYDRSDARVDPTGEAAACLQLHPHALADRRHVGGFPQPRRRAQPICVRCGATSARARRRQCAEAADHERHSRSSRPYADREAEQEILANMWEDWGLRSALEESVESPRAWVPGGLMLVHGRAGAQNST